MRGEVPTHSIMAFHSLDAEQGIHDLQQCLNNLAERNAAAHADDQDAANQGVLPTQADTIVAATAAMAISGDAGKAAPFSNQPVRRAPEYFGIASVCCGRGSVLYGREEVESAIIQSVLPDTPVVGFYAHGEIGPAAYREHGHGDLSSATIKGGSTVLSLLRFTGGGNDLMAVDD